MPAALAGARCPDCAVVTYPAAASCQRCGAGLVSHELCSRGFLWTWTVQRYAPKSPPYVAGDADYEPFVVGYVELDAGIRVEAIIDLPICEVRIGMPLELLAGKGVPRAVAVGTR